MPQHARAPTTAHHRGHQPTTNSKPPKGTVAQKRRLKRKEERTDASERWTWSNALKQNTSVAAVDEEADATEDVSKKRARITTKPADLELGSDPPQQLLGLTSQGTRSLQDKGTKEPPSLTHISSYRLCLRPTRTWAAPRGRLAWDRRLGAVGWQTVTSVKTN